ncbi:MAG: hypothetical protein ILM98_07470 [Kiritimatiellae bacterium]|jgi:predicted  nucleic acid-binding Zn-ribbon protein|nr:hypothetical protein [Kiritimatiellia bacterium]MBR4612057.1 hypothetical protein [Kiritimatiellia bacterium]
MDDINQDPGFAEGVGQLESALNTGDDIRETDIVFDCPYCGHGLVIDNRGAGLVIACASCGKPVQVPIPDGMDISDLDQGPENLQLQVRTLRNALLKAENRERELQKLLSGLTERRATLERARTNQLRRLGDLRQACERVQQQITEASVMMNRIFEMLQAELSQ